jgi:hypothetical protein
MNRRDRSVRIPGALPPAYCLLLSAASYYSFPSLENERSMVRERVARAIST